MDALQYIQPAKAFPPLSMVLPQRCALPIVYEHLGTANIIPVFRITVKDVSEEAHFGKFIRCLRQTKTGNRIAAISCFSRSESRA